MKTILSLRKTCVSTFCPIRIIYTAKQKKSKEIIPFLHVFLLLHPADSHEIYNQRGRPVENHFHFSTFYSSFSSVPDAYHKVIYDRTPPEKMIGFILPNAGSSKHLQDFAVTVDAVEQATGLDFLNLLPQPQQEQLENKTSIHAWNWHE